MRRDVFLYLTGPITAKHGRTIEDNVALALRVYIQCLHLGLPSFCPQLSGIFPTAHLDVDYETWLQYDYAVIDRCTHVVKLPNWEQSTGALREIAYANERNIPVIHHNALEELAHGWQISQ